MVENIHWLGHDSFRLEGEVTVYIDPWKLPPNLPKADIILITHEHYDHCSPEDVAKIQKADTVIVTIPAAAKKLKGEIKTVKPGDKITVKGIEVEMVPAYNIDKPFHPKEAGHVGFIVTLGGKRIYHAGDTDFIPEMKGLKTDIALLPVSGTYVMTADEAARAADAIKPEIAIPMHYGEIVGSEKDAERFKELTSVQVVILKPGQ
ncbi:MAG: MBL fold metallo-hydrolase [Anaerolineae bacterium]|nr:MBL fold metallo-hydrolase [Anaerolineae bacterium]MDW8101674.1 MBL fold metallo-hydrolase [Anaerolineae bacterium]